MARLSTLSCHLSTVPFMPVERDGGLTEVPSEIYNCGPMSPICPFKKFSPELNDQDSAQPATSPNQEDLQWPVQLFPYRNMGCGTGPQSITHCGTGTMAGQA